MYVYAYIYIYRERERGRDSLSHTLSLAHTHTSALLLLVTQFASPSCPWQLLPNDSTPPAGVIKEREILKKQRVPSAARNLHSVYLLY
jgi:hypothetical protein